MLVMCVVIEWFTMCVVIEWITMCVVPARESISVVIFFPGEGCVCVCIWGCVPLASLKASRNDPVFFAVS